MEKYGFVYIWYDRKRKMYYIGSHYGTENDNYICSSNRMRDAYRRRPDDFKRRIITRNIDRTILLDEEFKWLSFIKEDELGIKYYNLRKHKWGHWSTDENINLDVGKKISKAKRGVKTGKQKNPCKERPPRTEEWKKTFSENHPKPMLGKKLSDETKKRMSDAHKGKPKSQEHIIKSAISRTGMKRSEESKKRMSDAHKGTKKPWVKGQVGRRDSEETREKKRIAALIREQQKREMCDLNIRNKN